MIKFPVGATIAAMLVSSAAFAQSPTPGSTPAPTAPAEKMSPQARSSSGAAPYVMSRDDRLGSKLIGATLKTPTNESIGDITDLVVGPSGEVKGVIAGVGGFLGIGEHKVLLRFDQVQFNLDANERPVANTTMTRDQLKALPAWRDADVVRTK